MKQALLIVLSSVLVTAGCQGKPGSSKDVAQGKVAPRYTGKTVDGEYLALEDFRGKVVLLNVWATWCAPCRQELPELAALQEEHGGENFSVVGISVDAERDFQKVKAMMRQYDLDYPMVFDPRGAVVSTFEVRGYPTSMLLGKDGTIRWRRDGLIRKNDSEAAAAIRTALAEPDAK